MKSVSHIFLIDPERSLVEEAMQCRLQMQSKDDMGSLTIIVTPTVDDLHPSILRMATNVLLEWIEQAMKKPYKLSTFWKDWSHDNLNSHDVSSIESSPLPSPSIKHGDSGSCEMLVPDSAGILESEWQKYANAFGCSYVDRVILEGQVKV